MLLITKFVWHLIGHIWHGCDLSGSFDILSWDSINWLIKSNWKLTEMRGVSDATSDQEKSTELELAQKIITINKQTISWCLDFLWDAAYKSNFLFKLKKNRLTVFLLRHGIVGHCWWHVAATTKLAKAD